MLGEQGRGRPEAVARFEQRLADLKRNGCNVLLVGTDATDAACERLLGESSAGPRYRLFATTDARPDAARAKLAAVQSGPYADPAAVVNWPADVRGGVADVGDVRGRDGGAPCGRDGGAPCGRDGGATRGRDGSEPYTRVGSSARGSTGSANSSAIRTIPVESDDLSELRDRVEDAVASFEDEAGDLSPGELRLCVDSLTPLVLDYDDQLVDRFLADLIGIVESAGGMAHYHLPADYNSEVVQRVEPLFDAAVEVRRSEARVEQHWHLSDPDFSTGWLPL
ncbi:DUF7504 family protein [Halorussus litoreus]|uniref:DUF7504 family protein n=1 Tax=Halorussus litoreus TaxID=1710536 RepID=UPI0013004EBA|nr:hypothetical protein [Halorussus litoreus]